MSFKKISIIFVLFSVTIYAKNSIDVVSIIKSSFLKDVTVSLKQFKLSAKEIKVLQNSAKVRLDSNLIRMYTVKKDKILEGYAVIIVKKVRTKKAAVLYIVDSHEKIKSIEILAFREPSEYKPNKSWLSVFSDKTKEDNLFSKHGIPTISGATLSARAIADASRIALSIIEIYK